MAQTWQVDHKGMGIGTDVHGARQGTAGRAEGNTAGRRPDEWPTAGTGSPLCAASFESASFESCGTHRALREDGVVATYQERERERGRRGIHEIVSRGDKRLGADQIWREDESEIADAHPS